ncbi:hypothetical protein LGM38_28485 [Burkholderia vietnamiensis]|uniref:hypothetical protein n=1 Tax=Burkholderia vietnamiensis TaxID=60552 RepID=UPI0012DA4E2E|nr:hypothetical protein [Burkholderia vietnamiensis]MCA8015984.1 hypothetical protein [Burkholderia vietnamiensis]HDR8942550.1 hypothetical protein [Burkholderia vietnamiensis]HDR9163897.1 hypothetical protein [Burkholderia vietnamiensis]HDR9266161.1 hypothetical protein [Burkholderia vietnamiensis]
MFAELAAGHVSNWGNDREIPEGSGASMPRIDTYLIVFKRFDAFFERNSTAFVPLKNPPAPLLEFVKTRPYN